MSFSSPFSPSASPRQALPFPCLQPAPLSLRLCHQTKHHLSGRRMPEAALLEQMPPCSPQHTHIQQPPSWCATHHTHTRVHAALVGLPSPMQDGALGCRLPSPRLYSRSQPNGHPEDWGGGMPCIHLSRSQHRGCPVTARPPASGRAGRVLLPRWCLHSCRGRALPARSARSASSSHSSDSSRSAPRQQEPRASGGRGSKRPPTSGMQGPTLIKRSTSTDN